MTIDEAKKLDPIKANNLRFKKVFMELGIDKLSIEETKHLKILDMGCGNGDFIKYCKKMGIHAVGVTISPEQCHLLKQQNLEVYVGDYRIFYQKFSKKFDIITFFGTLEHITSARPCSNKGVIYENENRRKIFSHCKKYFKQNSIHKKIFTTTLHINPKYCNKFESYIMERAYGGWYHLDKHGSRLHDKLQNEGYKLLKSSDMSIHYYLASIIDKNHFGNPACLNIDHTLLLLFSIFINPFLIFMVIYTIFGIWMWQFDGKKHYCNETYKTMKFENNSDKRPTTLYWSIFTPL